MSRCGSVEQELVEVEDRKNGGMIYLWEEREFDRVTNRGLDIIWCVDESSISNLDLDSCCRSRGNESQDGGSCELHSD